MPNPEVYTVTNQILVEAFEEWLARYDKNPRQFHNFGKGTGYGEACADYLIDIIQSNQGTNNNDIS